VCDIRGVTDPRAEGGGGAPIRLALPSLGLWSSSPWVNAGCTARPLSVKESDGPRGCPDMGTAEPFLVGKLRGSCAAMGEETPSCTEGG